MKTRIVGVVLVKDDWCVQSIGFKRYLPVGRPEIAVEYLNQWGIDEIILLDMSARLKGQSIDPGLVARATRRCQVPVAAGGNVGSIKDMEALLAHGADKIVLNTTAFTKPGLVEEASRLFGAQCMVVSLDVRKKGDSYRVFTHGGSQKLDGELLEIATKVIERGAGEIMVHSIERDGQKTGFDLDLSTRVVSSIPVPVIISGGAGHPHHFLEAVETGPSGVAAANFWHFTEHSVILTKRYLVERGLDIRLDTYADYANRRFMEDGRLKKLPDQVLDDLRFEYVPEEKI